MASLYLYGHNVTGQGTRHLVEGTLDPLVGQFLIMDPILGQPIVHQSMYIRAQ